MAKFKKITPIVIIVIVSMLLITAAWSLHDRTLVTPLFPIGCGVALGLASGLWLWKLSRYLTDCSKRLPNLICHTILFTILFTALFYILNYTCADRGASYTETVTITAKQTSVHYHSRRVGRNRYTKGEPYNVYNIKIQFKDSTERSFRVPLSKYNKYRNGADIELSMAKGLFGAPVIIDIL